MILFVALNGNAAVTSTGEINVEGDDQGRVVQRVWTTRDGNYRFQNVDAGKYKVRVRKKGFEQEEIAVDAVTGKETDTKINLQKKQP